MAQEDVAPIRVGLLGAGTVGSQTARLLVEQKDELAARIGRPIELTGVACLDPAETDPFPWIDKAIVTTDTMSVATNSDIVIELIGGTGVHASSCLPPSNPALRGHRQQGAAGQVRSGDLRGRRSKGVDIYFEAPWAAPSRSSSRCANPSSETR